MRLPRTLHAESLLRIPLVRAAFGHATLAPRPRAVDARWVYERILPRVLSGFVPLAPVVFYGRRSRTATWLARPGASARDGNEGDHLAQEVLFCVHDHLHAWALSAMADLAPPIDVGPHLGPRDLDTLAFLHLATEAAATVGLDYWYLSTVDIDEVCPIGTLKAPLTTAYHERHLAEYRRFRPDLEVQTPDFFVELARFYCEGAFEGFGGDDLARSPRLARWLRHEVLYGEGQRFYVREWLAFLTGTSSGAARRPVPCRAAWQTKLLRTLGDRLWAYVKEGRDVTSGRPARVRVRRRALGLDARFDPRFVSLHTMDDEAIRAASRRETDPVRRGLLCEQLVAIHDFDRFDRRLTPALSRALEARDVDALLAVLPAGKRVEVAPYELREVFLLG